MKPCKFSSLDDENAPYVYPNLWQIGQTTGPNRIILAPSSDPVDLIRELTRPLPDPFGVLYVLVVPRGEGNEPGRYQSVQPCDRAELEAFLARFRDYLEGDGRHHLWIFSFPSQAQIVYDNHNVIYGYGPLDTFVAVAEEKGLASGKVEFPSPHVHHYNAAFDAEEQSLMNYWEWKFFPLRDDD